LQGVLICDIEKTIIPICFKKERASQKGALFCLNTVFGAIWPFLSLPKRWEYFPHYWKFNTREKSLVGAIL